MMKSDELENTIYSVSALVSEMRHLLESSYRHIQVEGEISNLASPASGHRYFSLKEKEALIRCAFFRNRQVGSVAPREGMQVLVRGQVSIYPGRGDLQLIVSHLEPAGEGALRRAFEQLKKRLMAEGLFDQNQKQPLPAWPTSIGIVSSDSGAALQDILVTLRKRFPIAHVVIYPTLVQGEQAAESICDALATVTRRDEVDVVLLARGGGSLEDLQPFNDERVARAIYACPLPIVSGVGHESDFTIADMVADQRGATPTAAAALVTPDLSEYVPRLTHYRSRLIHQVERTIHYQQQRIDISASKLKHPAQALRQLSTQRDHCTRRIHQLASSALWRYQLVLTQNVERLRAENPVRLLSRQRTRINDQSARLLRSVQRSIVIIRRGIDYRHQSLQLVNPAHTLRRGYAILQTQSGTVVTSSDNVRTGDTLDATVADGRFTVAVTKP